MEIEVETDLEKLRRKENQAWEMAGLARQDGDVADSAEWTKVARDCLARLRELAEARKS